MKIAIIGTGGVGRALAAALSAAHHEVAIGTRHVQNTLTNTEPDMFGNPPFAQWQKEHAEIELLSFPDAGAFGDVVINASSGANSLSALQTVGAENLSGKVLLDIALPLDLSQGLPPTLTVSNNDSLAEQIQREFPETFVVKSLNTVAFPIMVEPARVPGDHNLFVAGNNEKAKGVVIDLLAEVGWPNSSIIDLGDITGARGAEMYSRLYFTLAGALETFDFNIKIIH